jgi:acetate---CoA ligase (ADP-forming)
MPSRAGTDSKASALHRALHPRGIAVVGASRDPTKRGHQVVRALLERGFGGDLAPVNPTGGEVLGLSTSPSLESAPGSLDLAVICTPAASVPEVIRACGRRGIPGAVVLAAGFGELGRDGEALEAELVRAARESEVRVVGPNTSGILNLPLGLDLIGVAGTRPGGLALLTQSGNMSLTLLREAVDRPGEGFSMVIGVGNEADVAFHEYLELLGADPGIRAILVHAESFRQGGRFLEVAREVGRSTPVVVLKGGRTRAGDQAARSHTGAVATDHAVIRSGLRGAGIIEVTRSDDLLAVGRTLALQPPAAPLPTPLGVMESRAGGHTGSGLLILADGGGQGTLAADMLEELGVPLAVLEEGNRIALRTLLGPNAALANPVDLAGAADRDPGVFAQALDRVLRDPAVAGVLMVSLFGGYALRFAAELEGPEGEAALALASRARGAGKPLVIHSIYGEADTPAIRILHREGVPLFRSLETACRAAAATWERGQVLQRLARAPRRPSPPPRTHPEPPRARPNSGASIAGGPIPTARREGRTALLETETRALLADFGVPLVPARFCTSAAGAREALESFGAPVVLRAVSDSILHKSEAGGVALGLSTPEEVSAAHARVLESVTRFAESRGLEPGLRGVLVSPMLPPPRVELLVGMRRSPSFGPVISLGAGGVAVEVHRDVAVRILPLPEGEVAEMVGELRIAPLLLGYRGQPGVDLAAVTALVEGLARCAEAHPEISEIEMNPVFATSAGVVAVDARAYLAAAAPSGVPAPAAGIQPGPTPAPTA